MNTPLSAGDSEESPDPITVDEAGNTIISTFRTRILRKMKYEEQRGIYLLRHS